MLTIKNVLHDKTKGFSRLEFDIIGKEVNYVLVNTLRRIVLSEIPIYAYTEFIFDKNSSVFHNNFIKNQIRNLPVWGIDNKIEFYEKVKVSNNEVINEIEDLEDNVELGVNKKVNSTSLEQLTMYVDYNNKSNNIFSVTTEQAKFYFAQKQIPNPYPIPIQIVKLQHNQTINFTTVTSIGIEKENAIFSPVSICVYEEKKENEFKFIIESKAQITEKVILHRAIINLNKILESILNQFIEILDDNTELSGQIEIKNEDHTIGNLISYGLQNHKNITFASYYLPHPLEKRVIIEYKLKSGKFKNVLKDVINEYIELYNKLDKLIEKTI
jgi:DNA-directed RNA polymerase subunit L/DNA-directed RNA polymerase alpha subunit